MTDLLWLLLPVAAASGWWAARREYVHRDDTSAKNAEYFKGLNYLLDDKPDQAIEVFVKMVEVDRNTAETHLTLGNLFRGRGEVDRAIHIHRNLIARTNLTPQQRSRALLELGQDYMRAGLFDRAEALFRKLIEYPEHSTVALARLVDIYQQEKDWRQAIDYCNRLERLTGVSKKVQTAHFYCELAEAIIQRGGGDSGEARELLRQALARDPECVRANMLLGRMAMAEGDYPAAIAAFQEVERQGRCYFPEVIEPLGQCYTTSGRQEEWVEYLRNVQERDHSGRITVALAELLVHREGEAATLRFLETELRDYPTLLGLRCFIELKLACSEGALRADLDALYQISKHRLSNAAQYRCDHCGFVAKSLHWCCPGCKTWNGIKPIPDLICGDH